MYVRGRKHWNAKRPTSTTTDDWTRSSGVTAVVHHTAGISPVTMNKVKKTIHDIQSDHMNRKGWNDIGYNYLIDSAGRVWEGRPFGVRGAHTLAHNTNTIGISFLGNYEIMKLNALQIRAYKALIKKLTSANGVKIVDQVGHRNMPGQNTACPGKNIMKQLKL